MAEAGADWPARLSITAVPATPSRRGAGPHVREARRERARLDPGIPEILGFWEITRAKPVPRQRHPQQVTQGQLQVGLGCPQREPPAVAGLCHPPGMR